MIFETLFLVGLIGFLAMVGMGMMHGHGHDQGAHHSDHGFHHGGHHADHGAHDSGHGAHGQHAHDHGHGQNEPSQQAFRLPFFLSPLNIFSTCLGMGAVGLLTKGSFSTPLALVISFICGLMFTVLLIKPIFGLLLNFSSKPSEGLEGMVAQPAQAIAPFDAEGRGLIRLTLDGEVVQLLARLEQHEINQGAAVKRGDTVIITSIDAGKGTCTVTHELSQS